jgi:hypothetical protein
LSIANFVNYVFSFSGLLDSDNFTETLQEAGCKQSEKHRIPIVLRKAMTSTDLSVKISAAYGNVRSLP